MLLHNLGFEGLFLEVLKSYLRYTVQCVNLSVFSFMWKRLLIVSHEDALGPSLFICYINEWVGLYADDIVLFI